MTKYNIFIPTQEQKDIIRKYRKCHRRFMGGICCTTCDECEYQLNKETYLQAQMLSRLKK